MLQGINRLGKSWVGKVVVAILFGFLIVSFAVWGIGDIFRGNVRTQVATVGGVDITAEQFRTAYQTEYQNLIRRARRSITPEQARALGLEQRVLARLVSEAAFDQDTRRLGLSVSDELVIRTVQADPAFRGANGAFDRGLFIDILRQTGISEAQFVREQRAVVARQQLAEALTGAYRVPIAMREAVHRFQAERRSAEYLRLGPVVLGDIPAPNPAQMQSFYDERKTSFRAPEYRALSMLRLDAAALAKPDAVSDQDAEAYYARLKDSRFGQPERRAIQQIVFPTKDEAETASARIKAGTSFEDLAQERSVDEPTLNLGTLTRGEMIDQAVATAAFALAEGQVSDVVAGRFGPVLLRVTKVEAGSAKPFEEVKAEVKTELARERARTELTAVHDAIEDQRASAKPLTEIAKERGIALLRVTAVDRSGRDRAGTVVDLGPERDNVLTAAFRADVGADIEAVTYRDGGYAWFEVTAIEPAKDRTLDEVRDRVTEEWRANEVSTGLTAKARSLTERLDKGETMAAIAAELGLAVETATDLARGQPKDGLAPPVVTRIFATPVGRAASATGDDTTRFLFKVTAATVPPFITSTQESAATEQQIRSLVAEDLLAEYVADAEKRIGVKLYPSNVSRAIGGSDL
ncbi:SurA N-terminal domain-containing protein [uncultured Enterovirga sp.]|uniref:SurA N-terminal domain-containing protein n=1 Tax=uncultured Enterovirga sp. TaxID=2026352 RepID=UPI0035CC5194